MNVQPYVFFDGRCEEAIEFYKSALGAEVTFLMRHGESPEPPPPGALPAGTEKKILHGEIRIGDTVVLVSDGHCTGKPTFQGFSLAITAADDAQTERLFGALHDGGAVVQPLTTTFFTSRFGMVTDRFGVQWMVLTESQPPA